MSLLAMVADTQTKLVVVDPISSLVSTSSEQLVRRTIGAYAMPSPRSTTMLLIRHIGKASAGPAINPWPGATGLAAVARSILRVDEHPFRKESVS